MGVTDLQPYFMQITGHNSVNVHWIPTKLGTEICCMSPILVLNFSPIGARIYLYGKFCKACKNKNKKNRNWGRWYLGNGLGDVLQILYVDSTTAWALL